MNQFDDTQDTPSTPVTKRWEEDGNESITPPIPWEAMLCYLPVFCLYPWSLRKEMPEIEGHARQGMILFAVELALFLITVPVFYKIVWIAILVIAALGALAAYNGRAYKLPILWDLAEKVGVVEKAAPANVESDEISKEEE